MSHTYSKSVDINAPASRVWAVMSDIEHWREWTASVTSVKRLDSGPLRVGSRAEIIQPKLPPAQFTVTALEEGKGFTWETTSGGVKAIADHQIMEHGDRCQVSLSVTFSGALGWLAAGLVKKLTFEYLELEAAGLKRRCESK